MAVERRTLKGELLVEREMVRWRWWSLDSQGRVALADGTFIEPRTFDLLGPNGERLNHYGGPSNEAGIDDDIYVEVHYVRDGALYSAAVKMHGPTGALQLVLPRVVLRLV